MGFLLMYLHKYVLFIWLFKFTQDLGVYNLRMLRIAFSMSLEYTNNIRSLVEIKLYYLHFFQENTHYIKMINFTFNTEFIKYWPDFAQRFWYLWWQFTNYQQPPLLQWQCSQQIKLLELALFVLGNLCQYAGLEFLEMYMTQTYQPLSKTMY